MIRVLLSRKLGELRWTQADLARKTGIRPNTIVNVKMKMYKNADSKCTIMAKYFQIKYNLSGSD